MIPVIKGSEYNDGITLHKNPYFNIAQMVIKKLSHSLAVIGTVDDASCLKTFFKIIFNCTITNIQLE